MDINEELNHMDVCDENFALLLIFFLIWESLRVTEDVGRVLWVAVFLVLKFDSEELVDPAEMRLPF